MAHYYVIRFSDRVQFSTYNRYSFSKPTDHGANPTFQTMGHIYSFAFSPHGDEFAAYIDKDSDAVTWSFSPSNNASATSYQTLRDWLNEHVPSSDAAQMEKLRVVFGPGASYFACDGGHQCIRHDLPQRLSKAIEKRKAEGLGWPDVLALSAAAGRASWSLATESSLYKLVDDEDHDNLREMYLNPTRCGDFVAVHKHGKVTWSLPGGMSEDEFPR